MECLTYNEQLFSKLSADVFSVYKTHFKIVLLQCKELLSSLFPIFKTPKHLLTLRKKSMVLNYTAFPKFVLFALGKYPGQALAHKRSGET